MTADEWLDWPAIIPADLLGLPTFWRAVLG